MDDTVISLAIAESASLSASQYIGNKTLVGIEMPAAWDAANLTLQSSSDGSTFNNVYDKSGNEYTITAAAARAITINPDDLAGLGRYIKLRSGTAGTPVNQTAARTLKLIVKG